jgi:hypothetical protein
MRTGSAEIQGSVHDLLTDIARSSKPQRTTRGRAGHKRTRKTKTIGEETKQKTEQKKQKRSREEGLEARKRKRQRAASTNNEGCVRDLATSTSTTEQSSTKRRRRQRDKKVATKSQTKPRTSRPSSLKKKMMKPLSTAATAIDAAAIIGVPAHQVMLEHAESMEILDALRTLERLVLEGVVAPPVGQQVVDEELLEELRLQQFARSYANQAEDDVLADLVSDSPSTSPTVSRRGRGSNASSDRALACLLQDQSGSSTCDYRYSSSVLAMPMEEDLLCKDEIYDEEVLCSSYDLLPSVGDDSEY